MLAEEREQPADLALTPGDQHHGPAFTQAIEDFQCLTKRRAALAESHAGRCLRRTGQYRFPARIRRGDRLQGEGRIPLGRGDELIPREVQLIRSRIGIRIRAIFVTQVPFLNGLPTFRKGTCVTKIARIPSSMVCQHSAV